MKESIKKLRQEQSLLVDKLDKVNKPLKALKYLFNQEEMPTCVADTIALLEKDSESLSVQIKGFSNAIEGFQSACSHKNPDGSKAMVYDGHDSHKSYYKCSICGYEDDY